MEELILVFARPLDMDSLFTATLPSLLRFAIVSSRLFRLPITYSNKFALLGTTVVFSSISLIPQKRSFQYKPISVAMFDNSSIFLHKKNACIADLARCMEAQNVQVLNSTHQIVDKLFYELMISSFWSCHFHFLLVALGSIAMGL